MARLRVFVSSTCYDLGVLRSELRPFITGMGYEPVMSDYSDVLYDPRAHTHESCLKEVSSCDVVVLIIGARFGGQAVPAALAHLDFSMLGAASSKSTVLDTKEKLSITQLEVWKAVEQSIPVYAFVDDRVLHDHLVYEKNKDKPAVIEQLDFPSIQKKDTARYIFEFINFLTHRVANNGLNGFTRLDEIRSHLASQWSLLFQRLLSENRTNEVETRRYRDFSERIEDLKAVVLASIASPDSRVTAKGAVQFRRLIEFIASFRAVNHRALLLSDDSWEQLLRAAGVVKVEEIEGGPTSPPRVALVKEDGTFYLLRSPRRWLEVFEENWNAFRLVGAGPRAAIVDALLEVDRTLGGLLRYIPESLEEYLAETKARAERAAPEVQEPIMQPQPSE